ncbi:MAG: glycoside hydrolase family 3 N-terminal domain-containing protein [Planctomycetota bacterium]
MKPHLPRLIKSAGATARSFTATLACLAMVAATPAWGVEAPAIDYREYDPMVTPLLERMTLAEKIGQMTQVDLAGLASPAEVRELVIGSVLAGGNSDPAGGNSRAAWANAYEACQREAVATRLGVPILFGVDAVHGHSNVLGAVIYPHNIGLGCANDVDLVERIGRQTASAVRATGVQWNFAPCVTAPRDDRWGRTYEGYSEDPARIGPLGAALVRGLQGDDLRSPLSVMSCIKHFVGDGGTEAEVKACRFRGEVRLCLDQGDTRVDEETLRRLHVDQYRPSIAAGAGTVMPSYSSWNGLKCSANGYLLADVLKGELGFRGFVVSDWDAIDQCHEDYKTAIKLAINAGVDMAMISHRHREYLRFLSELVEEGEVPLARIDDAVLRILRVKAAMGMLDASYDYRTPETAIAAFGSESRRGLAREAVRKSIVLLKNNGVAPLAKSGGRIHVAGPSADDLGVQCGGWTIDWQGKAGEVTTGGTTILSAIRDAVGAERVSHDTTGEGADDADAAVVVVGEPPYAEGFGDDADLRLSDDDLATIRRVAASGTPMTLVILSGRPLALDDETVGSADAIFAAWLPGTEGSGVADILFGDAEPSGTLSFTWPNDADEHPTNVGDADYSPRYPYGYGLTYTPFGEASTGQAATSTSGRTVTTDRR